MPSPDTWTDGEWFTAIFEPYVAVLGEPLLGTILAGTIILAFYIHSGDIVLPTILVFILGGVLTAVLPGDMINIARSILVIGMAAAFMSVARRYIL